LAGYKNDLEKKSQELRVANTSLATLRQSGEHASEAQAIRIQSLAAELEKLKAGAKPSRVPVPQHALRAEHAEVELLTEKAQVKKLQDALSGERAHTLAETSRLQTAHAAELLKVQAVADNQLNIARQEIMAGPKPSRVPVPQHALRAEHAEAALNEAKVDIKRLQDALDADEVAAATKMERMQEKLQHGYATKLLEQQTTAAAELDAALNAARQTLDDELGSARQKILNLELTAVSNPTAEDVAKFTDAAGVARAEATAHRSRVHELEAEVRRLKTATDEEAERSQSLERQLVDMRFNVNAERQKVEAGESTINQLKTTADRLSRSSESERQTTLGASERMAMKAKRLENEIKESGANVRTLTAQRDKALREISLLEENLTKLSFTGSERQGEMSKLQSSEKALKAALVKEVCYWVC
jgi:hypothetical protein